MATTITATADSFTTQLSSNNANFYTSSSSTGNYFNYAVGHTAENPGSTSTSYNTYVKDNSNNTATGFAIYSFDFSEIPVDSSIDSMTVKCYGACESTTHDSTHKANITLRTGSTTKSTEQYFTSTSNSTITISSPGTWTRAELQNAKLYFEVAYYGGRLFGITWTVTYTYTGVTYTITATSDVSGITIAPSSSEVYPNDELTLRIDGNSIDGLSITDNGSSITSSLVRHNVETGGSDSTTLGSYTLVSGSFNGSGATFFSGRVGQGANASTTTSNYYSGGSGTIAVFTYDLVFDDIPSNATITQLYVEVNGHAESTSNSNEYMCAALYLGTSTAISDELNFKSIGTSNSTQTITATTLPTVAQLSNLKLRCRLGYYGGAINGATCYITYTVPSTGNDYYWTYTLSNISANHTVIIGSGSGSQVKIFIKKNGSWVQGSKVYKKVNGSWVEQASSTWTTILPTTDDYRLIEV